MSIAPSESAEAQHILLTSLGIRLIDTTYQFQQRTATAPLTPLALVQLLPPEQRPNRVIAMVTAKAAQDVWPTFRDSMHAILGFPPESPVFIPEGRNDEEIRQILEAVAQRFPTGVHLTLDVTQGLRHFPFIVYALALYLTSLRGVQVQGAYYGMFETEQRDEPKPIIDLRQLLVLPEWFHAVRIFRDQGTTLPITRLIRPFVENLRQEAAAHLRSAPSSQGTSQGSGPVAISPQAIERSQQARQVEHAADMLEQHAFAYEAALPLELGKASRLLIEPIRQLASTPFAKNLPLATALTEAITAVAATVALPVAPPKRGKWKRSVPLDAAELQRQAQMIEAYLDRGQFALAVGLMREWVISWSMWQAGQTDNWLSHTRREPFERRLGALKDFARTTSAKASDAHKEFGDFWNRLTDELRNAFHHHAMRDDALEQPPEALVPVRRFWERLRHGQVTLPTLGGGSGCLLLSPQGTRPGVLFSALQVAHPDTCVVICSAASAPSIPEAATRATFTGSLWQITLHDALGGFDEIAAAIAQARPWLLEADTVIANMTGGTTLMGLVIQRLAEEARRLDRPVRRFALIDRRTQIQQDAEPFVQGDCYWLDARSA